MVRDHLFERAFSLLEMRHLTKVLLSFPLVDNSVVHAISVLSNQQTTHTQRCHIPCSHPPHLRARISLKPSRESSNYCQSHTSSASGGNLGRAVLADEEKVCHLFPQIIHKIMSQVPLTRNINNSRSYNYFRNICEGLLACHLRIVSGNVCVLHLCVVSDC